MFPVVLYFQVFLLVSPSADPSGGCHIKNVVREGGLWRGGLPFSSRWFEIYFSIEELHLVREQEQGFRCIALPATCKLHKVRESAGPASFKCQGLSFRCARDDYWSSRRAISVQRTARVTPRPQQSLRKEEKAVKKESPTGWRILFPFLPMLIHFSSSYQIDLHTFLIPATTHFTYAVPSSFLCSGNLTPFTPSLRLHITFLLLFSSFSPHNSLQPSSSSSFPLVVQFPFVRRPSLLAAILLLVLHPHALRGSVAVIMKCVVNRY